MAYTRRLGSLMLPLALLISVAVASWIFLKDNAALAQSPEINTKELKETNFSPTPYNYVQREPSRDGTGKVYMDREISLVMGHEGLQWLERTTREREENPTRAVEGLELAPDAVVADIGSGSGYYTFRIAPLVPKGSVIGVDIQPEMASYLSAKSKKLGVNNVKSHLGKIDDIALDSASIDAAVLVDAYHEFSHPNEMMQSVFYALRPGGRVYLIEYRAEDPKVPIKPLHKMTEAQAIKEMKAVGLEHVRTDKFLPWQHFMIFKKP
jgi:SAM-dependent methyltransferase